MVLVDSSVWIDHLRRGLPDLVQLLENDVVLMHPMVLGEIACDNARNRAAFLTWLAKLPPAAEARHSEAMLLLERSRLWGRGLGWVDLHLLASAKLSSARLWTRDSALNAAAEACGVPLL